MTFTQIIIALVTLLAVNCLILYLIGKNQEKIGEELREISTRIYSERQKDK